MRRLFRRRVFRRRRPIRRRYGRRTRRVFRRRGRITTTRVRAPIQSDATYVKLKYAETYVIGVQAPTVAYNYRGNDVYDPDPNTSGSKHALGFTNWMTFYRRQCALASKIIVTITNLNPDGCIDAFLYATTNEAQISNTALLTTPSTVYKRISPRDAGGATQRLVMYRTTRRVVGGPIVNNQTYWGSAVAGPPASGQWYWHVYFTSNVPGVNASNLNIQFNVRIKYYCKLFSRITDLPLTDGLTGPENEEVQNEALAPWQSAPEAYSPV